MLPGPAPGEGHRGGPAALSRRRIARSHTGQPMGPRRPRGGLDWGFPLPCRHLTAAFQG